METVVVVTARIGHPSDTVAALRASGFRVTLRDLARPVSEIAFDEPDLVVVEVPEGTSIRDVAARFQPQTSRPDDVPRIAIVATEHLVGVSRTKVFADFCHRPLEAPELIARVRRLVQGSGRDDDDRIRIGDLVVDLRGYEASVDGRVLDLTYQEFELLKFLAANPGRAFSREQLLTRVWGHNYFGGSRTVDIHVRRIRAKLAHPYSALIQTIRHVGYKWTSPTEVTTLENAG
ncbi:MAG: DNA-binding response OmpR family regulator [Myxococcota bacterium]